MGVSGSYGGKEIRKRKRRAGGGLNEGMGRRKEERKCGGGTRSEGRKVKEKVYN